MSGYVFVGERRSRRAQTLGVTWHDGRLAACTLFAALRLAGIDPASQQYMNAYHDDGTPDEAAIARAAELSRTCVIVGLGQRAQAALDRGGVPHVKLIHPAARGAIRARQRYQEHVLATLGDWQGGQP